MFNMLLVENDRDFRQALSDTLLCYFPLIDVEEADDGEDALRKVEYQRPRLIIMNAQLPGEDGLDVARKIKRTDSSIAIVLLASARLSGCRQQALQGAADCFLLKEDDSCMDDMLARIETEIARQSGHRSTAAMPAD